MNWEPVLQWASEKSTIVGFLSACTMLGGWIVSPDQIGAIATVTTTAASVIAMVTRER